MNAKKKFFLTKKIYYSTIVFKIVMTYEVRKIGFWNKKLRFYSFKKTQDLFLPNFGL